MIETGVINHRKRTHEKSSLKMKFECDTCKEVFEYTSNFNTNQELYRNKLAITLKNVRQLWKIVSKTNCVKHKKQCYQTAVERVQVLESMRALWPGDNSI